MRLFDTALSIRCTKARRLFGLRLRELLLRKVESRLDEVRLAAVGQEILWAVFLIC